ncbi:MAG TPA: NAD(P)-binding domain-containing protein [Galbitalea sp.]|jgi:2-hydroxy-3-oxopropionate reductase
MKLAFIGLGAMGAPMAENLVRGGITVTGYNRSPEPTLELERRGGHAAPDIATAVRDADIAVTMLPDTPDVLAVMEGPDGVLENMRPGTLAIDFSTIAPAASVRLAAEARLHHLDVLDAPVSGGVQGARDGSLAVMVGGEEDAFRRARDVLDLVGKTVVRVGRSGSGQTVKAANQMIVGGAIEILAEAIVFLGAHDVNLEAAIEVLSGGLAASTVLTRKAKPMLDRTFAPSFRLALHDKDLGIALASARTAGLALPVSALVAQLMSSARTRGYGELDHAALFEVVRSLSEPELL